MDIWRELRSKQLQTNFLKDIIQTKPEKDFNTFLPYWCFSLDKQNTPPPPIKWNYIPEECMKSAVCTCDTMAVVRSGISNIWKIIFDE